MRDARRDASSLVRATLFAAACCCARAQLLLNPGDPSYANLPSIVNRPLNPNPDGSTASKCCPGGLPDYAYPSDCSPTPQGCNCHAEMLCPLPLPIGTGPGESEGPGPGGALRNIVHDPDLWYTLKCLNQQDFGPSVLTGCGDAYSETRLPNKIKGFVNWIDDLGNSIAAQQLSPSFSTHLGMGRKCASVCTRVTRGRSTSHRRTTHQTHAPCKYAPIATAAIRRLQVRRLRPRDSAYDGIHSAVCRLRQDLRRVGHLARPVSADRIATAGAESISLL